MFIIELVKNDEVIAVGIIEQGNQIAWTPPTPGGYKHCSKFHNKERAEKAAKKVESKYRFMKDDAVRARVVSEFGGPIQGEKSSVPEKRKIESAVDLLLLFV